MSRWLRNVNALLENLDTQVEETVDERFNDHDTDDANSKDGDNDAVMDDILAKRGLLLDDDDENGTSAAVDDDVEKDDGEDVGEENDPAEAQQDEEEVDFESEADEDRGESNDEKSTSAAVALQSPSDDANLQPSKVKEHVRKESMDDQDEKEDQAVVVPAQTQKLEMQPAAAKSTNTVNTPPTNTNTSSTTLQLKDKEIKKYRRTILQLNNTLTTAESEIEAQRSELERAASRIERDRSRFKSEKESLESSHKAEIIALTADHERALNNYKRGMDEQLREMEGRIARAEQARVQEGGERDAELSDALQRERTALEQVANINDEKNTLIERVSSLSSEVARLNTRLEHATSQLELASNRERNAEEQLDKALSLHARQLGVRQKRESELEQTVADLGAALVVAKSKVERKLEANSITSRAYGKEEEEEGLQDKLEDAQDEIETLKAQLTLERQRIQTLHVELQDLSKEHSEELAGAHVRQRQYERQISDLTTAVGKLQSNLSSSKPGSGDEGLSNVESSSGLQYSGDETKETDHLRKQIASLSEKIFTQQSKLDRTSGEISTLKTRLQSAILRAETAENSLEGANQRLMMLEMMPSGGYATSGVSSADEEMATAAAGRRRKGPSSRRRVPMGDGTTTRRLHRSKVESIRSALGLHHGRIPSNTCQETTAVILDTCDTIAIDLGSHFRHYPLSRLAFMLYMVLLHAWAFFLLVYHAHAQGTGGLDHYSPESMMMSYRHVEQMPKVAALNQVPLPPSVDKVPILPPQANQMSP